MVELVLRLFGPFDARLGDDTLSRFRTTKVQALLIYLAVEPPVAHTRDHLIELLWPDLPVDSARTNLRQIVYQLRKQIPDVDGVELVLAQRNTIQRNPPAALSVDAGSFAKLVARVHRHVHADVLSCPDCHHWLKEATALYNGPFLADFFLDDSNEFEDWARSHRESFHRQMLDALNVLAQSELRRNDFQQAQTYAWRQVQMDELDERGYRHLMEAMARSGRRQDALAVYDQVSRLLRDELGMAPSNQTTSLAELIRADQLEEALPRPVAVRGYRLLDEIGAGALGVVHRAYQPVVGREVAIKVIRPRYANNPAFIRRFESEAQTVARLEHPHIVPLYDYWREPDSAYLVMRWLRGGSLAQKLAAEPLPLDSVVTVVDQIAAALQAAHRLHIIHRDVKAANILLDEEDNAYLSDFSVAAELSGDETPLDLSHSPETISPEQLLREEVSPQSDQYSLGIVIYEMLTGRAPIPIDSPPAELRRFILDKPLPIVATEVSGLSPAIDDVLRRATAKRPEDRFPDMIALARAFQGAVATSGATVMPALAVSAVDTEAAVMVNPYKGLRAFQESDAATFFGREALVERLASRLDSVGGTDGRFLCVVGPSGSGKSSVVKAGLLPALRAGVVDDSEGWFVTEMTPGERPLEELATALMRVAVDPPANLLESLEQDERGLIRVLERILPADHNGHAPQLVLVVDQLEELYTLTEEDATRQQFIDSMLAALDEPHSRLRLVATLRADFYDRPLQAARLGEYLRQNTEVVLPLSPAELESAVTQPAARAGVRLEPGLLTGIIAEVAEQPGTLPLMQYALTELFEQRVNGAMTNDAYRAIGGVSGALGRRASEIYDGLQPTEQLAARQMFLRLVTLGEGVEDTRRRTQRAELEALDISGADINQVIDTFGRYRLLSFDRDPATRSPTVEVAHEALLREWELLRGWLDESRADVRMQRLLATEAAAWRAASEDESYLLRGARLEQYDGWVEMAGVSLTGDEQAYLTASLAARDQRQAEEEARRQRELETARQLAETERQRAEEQAAGAAALRRRAFLLAGLLGVAALLALAAVSFARSSNENASIAATRAAEANDNAALAVENANLASTRQAEAVANAGLAATRETQAGAEADFRATAEADAETQRDVALAREREALESYSLSLAANARQALEANDQQLALLLALAANTIDSPPLSAWRTLLDVAYAPGETHQVQVGSAVNTLVISPDGKTMLGGRADGTVRLWDINTVELLKTLEGHTDAVTQIVFNSDGTKALSGGEDGRAILWDVATGAVERELIDGVNGVGAVAFLPGEQRALIGKDSQQLQGELIIWEPETGEIVRRFGGDLAEQIEGVRAVAVSPDGRTVLAGYRQESAFDTHPAAFWDIETGEVIHFLSGATGGVESVVMDQEGRRGYGAAGDGNVYIWELESGELVHTLRGHDSPVTSLALSPDGLTLLSGSIVGELILWDLATQQPLEHFSNHKDAIWGAQFLDDAEAITASADGTLREWDLSSRWQLDRWRDPQAPPRTLVNDIVISPDGRLVITESSTGSPDSASWLTLWDYRSGQSIRRLEPEDSFAQTAVFDSDSSQVLTGNFDGSLSLFDLDSGSIVQQFGVHNGRIEAVDISTDGRYALSTGFDGQVNYSDLVTGDVIWRMTGHFEGHGNTDVAFLPGDQQAVSSSWDGTMILWDLATGEQIRRLNGLAGGHGGHLLATGQLAQAVNQLAMMTSGRHFLSASNDRSILMWDAATGESLMRFSGHSQPVHSVDLTPDESLVLSGALDESMILWDIATARPIRQFHYRHFADGTFAPRVAIHPSGQVALASDIDGSIITWQLAEPGPTELGDWIAGNRVLRELTCLERVTYQIEPLCEDGRVEVTSADLLAQVRRAVADVDTTQPARPGDVTVPTSAFQSPERLPRVAHQGENRGELSRGNFDVWLYEGKADEVISIRMAADQPVTDPTMPLETQFEAGVLDTKLFLVTPDGTVLALIDDDLRTDLTRHSDAYIVAVRLPVDGQYRIEARSKYDDHAGPYTLTIEPLAAIWNQELFEEYSGYYVEGPWQYGTYIFVDDGRLWQVFDFSGEQPYEQVPIAENDFISGGGGHTIFTRDENGNVNGYRLLLTTIHYVSGQWYFAERIGDLPPGFIESLQRNP